jgi:hypothetical protein
MQDLANDVALPRIPESVSRIVKKTCAAGMLRAMAPRSFLYSSDETVPHADAPMTPDVDAVLATSIALRSIRGIRSQSIGEYIHDASTKLGKQLVLGPVRK